MPVVPDRADLPLPDSLTRPLRRLLRPLVRLLIRSGVTFPVFADLLRGLYVEVAATDLLPDPKSRTDSRISLLTGVHRKEIRRLREEGADLAEVPAVVTLATGIIARWLGQPSHTGPDGRPLPLPRSAPEGVPSFEGLVASVTTDVRPRAVLDDWIAQGIVRLDAEDRVHLLAAAFLPAPGKEEQLFFFARNLHDHIAAATANVAASGSAPFLDRSVHYDGLSPEVVTALEAAGRESAQRMLIEINRLALALLEEKGEAAAGTLTRRFNLGVYLYAEDDGNRAEG